jgi:hypothetical protein
MKQFNKAAIILVEGWEKKTKSSRKFMQNKES